MSANTGKSEGIVQDTINAVSNAAVQAKDTIASYVTQGERDANSASNDANKAARNASNEIGKATDDLKTSAQNTYDDVKTAAQNVQK